MSFSMVLPSIKSALQQTCPAKNKNVMIWIIDPVDPSCAYKMKKKNYGLDVLTSKTYYTYKK